MNNSFLSNDNLDEVVFEGRNKQYGAYQLRKSYDSHLLKAVIFSFGLLLLAVGVLHLASLLSRKLQPIIVAIQTPPLQTAIRQVEIIFDPIAEPMSSSSVKKKVSGNFEITQDPLATKPPIIPLEPITSGSATGSAGAIAGIGQGATGVLSGGETPHIEAPTIETFVSEMPSFPGGVEKMMKYLASEINYPPQARENGIEGKVIVSFVVQTDGSIGMFTIEKSLGFGCDAEALRVLAAMPKWNAGKQNGRLKAVKLVLPIVFKLQ